MISIIADAHIRSRDHITYKNMLLFFDHEKVNQSSEIFLLGDIFEGMLGVFDEYFDEYSEFFNALEKLIKKGVRLYYLQGNHDIHLNLLYQKFLLARSLPLDSIIVENDYLERSIEGKKFVFTHGDLIVPRKLLYKIYRGFINSAMTRVIAEKIIGYSLFCKMVGVLSKRSRLRKKQRFTKGMSKEEFRSYFRTLAHKSALRYSCDYFVVGHSHFKDEFIFSNGLRYINPGSFSESSYFVTIKDGAIFLHSL